MSDFDTYITGISNNITNYYSLINRSTHYL